MTLEFTYMTYAYSFLLSALIAAGITELMRRLALRWQVLDHPGGRKTQETPVPLLGGLGIAIVSTSKGIMSDKNCRLNNMGGEVLCTVS